MPTHKLDTIAVIEAAWQKWARERNLPVKGDESTTERAAFYAGWRIARKRGARASARRT